MQSATNIELRSVPVLENQQQKKSLKSTTQKKKEEFKQTCNEQPLDQTMKNYHRYNDVFVSDQLIQSYRV